VRIALVIEDDFATRRTIAQLLLTRGYGVCETVAPEPIPFVPSLDVIVTDVVTAPDLDSVRAWTRSLQERFGVPVVLVTGREHIITAGAATIGVADVVPKPFDVDELAERVALALSTFQAEVPLVRWN
jgi:DNA-binding NtrC family response regulator